MSAAAPPVIAAPPDERRLLHPAVHSASDAALADQLLAPIWSTPRWWWPLLAVSGGGTLVFVGAITYSVWRGPGVWGNNIPVAWAFPIINFVWWIGIGHAGTFISAFLLLLNQKWRASVNRIAEAMTLFALVNAGLFPVLHLGRPWFAYWLIPYPSTMGVWPNFKSALPWDMAAVATYFIVSLLFWYLGLVPDLALARDRAPTRRRAIVYGLLALGWRGAAEEWRRHRVAYTLLAGLATPLVISVHSVVSLDFSITQLPGWHSTIFPPYFVAGAIYSGLAMVLVLLIPIRAVYGLRDVITDEHLDKTAKLFLAIGLMVAYSYVVETFVAWYSASPYERYTYLVMRPRGPIAWSYWVTVVLNVATPQLFWSRRLRRSTPALLGAGLAVLLGMWLERFMLIVTSLQRDFLPSSWHGYAPTAVDLAILGGSVGLFGFLFLLFLRFVPFVPVSEVKQLRYEIDHHDLDRAPPERGASMHEIVSPAGAILAEFTSADEMLHALAWLRERGYGALESFSPFAVPGASERIGGPRSRLPWLVFGGGLAGAVIAYAVQWYVNVRSYPLDIGGRPVHAVPAFLLPTFEGAVLAAALTAFVGLLASLRLPRPWHPVFEIDRFEHATVDRYWVAIDLADARAEPGLTARELAALRPLRVVHLEPSR